MNAAIIVLLGLAAVANAGVLAPAILSAPVSAVSYSTHQIHPAPVALAAPIAAPLAVSHAVHAPLAAPLAINHGIVSSRIIGAPVLSHGLLSHGLLGHGLLGSRLLIK